MPTRIIDNPEFEICRMTKEDSVNSLEPITFEQGQGKQKVTTKGIERFTLTEKVLLISISIIIGTDCYEKAIQNITNFRK